MLKHRRRAGGCVNRIRRFFVTVLAAGMLLPFGLHAQASAGAAKRKAVGPFALPVKMLNNHLFVLAYVLNGDKSIPIALEVSLEEPAVMVANVEVFLDFYRKQGEKVKSGALNIDFIFKPDVEVTIPYREIQIESVDERGYFARDLAQRFSKFVDEYSIRGRLGRGFFAKYRTIFDIGSGVIMLYPLEQKELQADVVLPFDVRKGLAAITVDYGDGKRGSMILGSENYDTYVDAGQAKLSGYPTGEFKEVLVGEGGATRLNLARYLTFRPFDFTKIEYGYSPYRPIACFVPRPQSFSKEEFESKVGTTFMSGVNLLEKFIVEFDWANSKVGLTASAVPKVSEEDQLFIKAEQSGSADQMQAYLERYPKSRLAAEAAWRQINWRLADPKATDDQLISAMQSVIDTSPVERKMEDVEEYVRRMGRIPGRADLTIRAGELAASYSREAMVNHIVQRIHNHTAEAYLDKDDPKTAWKYLLSASFLSLDGGGPLDEEYDDKPVNPWHNMKVQLNLAVIYEKWGRNARAYSRYRMAAELLERRGWLKEASTKTEEEIASLPPDNRRWCRAALQVIDALNRIDKQLSAEDREIVAGH